MQHRHIILSISTLFALVPALGAQEDAMLLPPVSLVCAKQYPALSGTPLGTMISGIPEVGARSTPRRHASPNKRRCPPDSAPNS